MFSSLDGVLFYVNSSIITATIKNAFFAFLPTQNVPAPGAPISIPEISVTLNVILHGLYGLSCAHHFPTLDELTAAVDCMPTYGVIPKDLILPGTPLSDLLLSHAPLQPIIVYALGAYHDIDHLAVEASSHLLAFPLSGIQDDLAARIGAVYLKRLFMLHISRLAALRDILLSPPKTHDATAECGPDSQSRRMRTWALIASSLVLEARPGMCL